MFFQGLKQWVRWVKGLHPHFAGGTLRGIASCAATGLHQQRKQTLGCSEVTREQGAVWVDGRYQCNAPEIVPLGNHLSAHQHIHFAAVNTRKLCFQRTL